jgi:Pilus assembly protein, PilO
VKKQQLNRTKLVIGGLGAFALLVVLAGFLLVVEPQRSHLSSVNAQIGSAQLQLAGLHSGASTKPDTHAAELFQLARAMPDSPDVPDLIFQLSQLAQQSSVSLVEVDPLQEATQQDGSATQPMNVTVDGTWKTLTVFLHDMRQLVQMHGSHLTVGGRLFNVATIAINPKLGDQIEAQLLVNAFVFGQPIPASTPTTTTSTNSTTTTSTTSSGQQAAPASGGGS